MTLGQSNIPAVTAEIEKQYTFSNIVYINIIHILYNIHYYTSKLLLFSVRSSLKGVLLKCRQIS